VQIHDETMQAVGAVARHGRDFGDVRKRKLLMAETEARLKRIEPARRGIARLPISGTDRFDHRLHVGEKRFRELGEARRLDAAIAARASAGDKGPRRHGIESRAAAFGAEIRDLRFRLGLAVRRCGISWKLRATNLAQGAMAL
jgi:hypothetical protein